MTEQEQLEMEAMLAVLLYEDWFQMTTKLESYPEPPKPTQVHKNVVRRLLTAQWEALRP